VRVFADSDAYWDDNETRRRYSIPHSDGSFFSDGSGYSNGSESDLHYEIIERLRETALRLEQIDEGALNQARDTATNLDFIPYAAEIEADIRLTRTALAVIDDADVSESVLKEWLDTFTHLAGKYIGRAAALAGTFLENAAVEGGKEFGKTAVKVGGLGLSLYLAGVDFQGIATAISAFLALKQAAN